MIPVPIYNTGNYTIIFDKFFDTESKKSQAVNFLRNGGTVFTLQRAGGWKSLQAMRPYIKMNENDIQTAMREHSPVDNLK